MLISIRPAVSEEYGELEQLNLACGEEPKWENFLQDTAEKTYIPLQNMDPSLVFVAELGDQLVGYLTADEFDPDKKIVAIETVFVLKEYRRKGIATQLVNSFCKTWIGEKGFKIHLYAVGYDSFQFFQSLGWDYKWTKMEKSSVEV